MTNTLYETPVLHATTRTGLKKFWRGFVYQAGHEVYTQTEHWQELAGGGESVRQRSAPVRIEGKNIGRANETALGPQGISEMKAFMKRQRDKKGYREQGEAPAPSEPLRPMLAEKFLESSDKLDWTGPVHVQPKLDGVRALFDGQRFTTRGGLEHPSFLVARLGFNNLGLVLDGELLLDPAALCCKGLSKVERFQLSTKAAKKDHPQLTPHLRYFCYDVVDEDLPFSERYARLEALHAWSALFQLVPTVRVHGEDDVTQLFQEFLKQGHEGLMVRDDSDGYELGHRSTQLQKLKEFEDAEFLIIGITDGKGKDEGTAKLTCRTSDGVAFDARLMGALEVRREVYENRAEYLGELATVRFEGYTADGKPRFPRALGVRQAGV